MAEQQERRLSDSYTLESDDPVTKKDLLIMSLKIESMFKDLTAAIPNYAGIATLINTQISEHKADCELCKKDYLLKSECQDAWEKCNEVHSDKQMQTMNKYWEIGKKIIIAGILIASGGSITKIIEALG